MNIRLAVLLLAVVASPALAQSATGSIPPTITIDCQRPLLPSQQAVSRLTGVDNFSQVYAVRFRLMGEARRACQRNPGVGVVVLTRPQSAQWVADR